MFQFEPYQGDLCTGNFSIDHEALRKAFVELASGDHVYGCRRLNADGSTEPIRLMNSCRRGFEERCVHYGSGEGDLADFKELLPPQTGLVVYSLQNSNSTRRWTFNELANSFLKNLRPAPHCYAEELDIVLFLGSYNLGFGLHKDAYDTAMFVLNGTKSFVVEVEGHQRPYKLEAGKYLRWTSNYAHTNWNPKANWSMSLHFTLGPAASKRIRAGTPVEYIHPDTKYKSYIESM